MISIAPNLRSTLRNCISEAYEEAQDIMAIEGPRGKRLCSQNFISLLERKISIGLPQNNFIRHEYKKTTWGHFYLELSLLNIIPGKHVICHFCFTNNPNKFPSPARYREVLRHANPTIQTAFDEPSFSFETDEHDKIYWIFCVGYNETAGVFGMFKQPDGVLNTFVTSSANCMEGIEENQVPTEEAEKPDTAGFVIKEFAIPSTDF